MIPFKGVPSVSPIRAELMQRMSLTSSQFDLIWDKPLTFATGNIQIDTLKLDDILHDRFGEYEMQHLSMEDLVADKYGKEAVELLKRLM